MPLQRKNLTINRPALGAGASLPNWTLMAPQQASHVMPAPYFGTTFGQQRTANPYTFADIVNKYQLDPADWGQSVATGGSVTFLAAQSAGVVAVTAANGSRARLRTNVYFRYQAGRGCRVLLTNHHADSGQANQRRDWGQFDDNDGVIWRLSGTALSFVIRSSTSGAPVETTLARASWYDPMDGTGPSGVVLDLTMGNIWEIEYQWLGVGVIRGFINGLPVFQILNQNTIAAPYMRTATLPIQCEVVNTAASTVSSVTVICTSISSEGGNSPPHLDFCAFNPADITVTTERPLLTIRPTLTFQTIENRCLLIPKILIISNEGNRAGYRMVLNPATLTGPAFAAVDAQSAAEFDVAATALTGGTTLLRGMLPNTNDNAIIYLDSIFHTLGRKLTLNAFGTAQDTLVITAVNESGGGGPAMRASITWGEER
jgi:hypothetical protein